MTPETIKTFLRRYLGSLAEETQETANGRRFGFDYVIEQLGGALGWSLLRSPSHPASGDRLPRPKKEAEHGVDYAFFSADSTELLVFVLKDEALTYKNFTAERFDTDLRRAASHDLTLPEFQRIKSVRVILAYNQSEEEEGVEEFNRLTKSLGTKVGDTAGLAFERWNLERLIEKVEAHLLSPALLPPNFFRSLTYLCWQVGDFSHGSTQWEEVLLPDWKEFFDSILAGEVTVRSVWMTAIALPIIRQHGKKEPAFETGWLELLEWAMLALWKAERRTKSSEVKRAVFTVWLDTYLQDLERFYNEHADGLAIEHSLVPRVEPSFQAVAESYLAFWHLGRLGVLWIAYAELDLPDKPELKRALAERLGQYAGWMVNLVQTSPGAMRPVLDVHHVELFLFWHALVRLRETEFLAQWMNDLYERLLLRRRDGGPLRLIASDNSWESIFEFITEGEPPTEGFGRSSYLLLMLFELSFSLPEKNRDELLESMHDHLVLGRAGDGSSLELKERIEMAGWAPPDNWEDLVMAGRLEQAKDRGVALMTSNFTLSPNEAETPLADRVRSYVAQSRQNHPFKLSGKSPLSVLALACIKNESPLPSEFWRRLIFESTETREDS